MRAYRALVLLTLGLTYIVVVVGAYVRLSDAGLGCPDWPLCYGQPLPTDIADRDALAKAWKEMGHRYLAGALGMLIFAITLFAWKTRRFRWLATGILALVLFQATLGKWTVTMLLKPAIVTAHLLGGMAILALLAWLGLSLSKIPPDLKVQKIRIPAMLALAAVVVQIALGGWVSANYAALACPDLPGCRGEALPPMNFADAFHLLRDLGHNARGELLPLEALTAIHWVHRVFALVVVALVGWAALKAFEPLKTLSVAVAALLALQFMLGVANVAAGLPLWLAAAHNGGAALLLLSLVVLNFSASR
jgi:cytochrome c oxidase assembly protein subunit 15